MMPTRCRFRCRCPRPALPCPLPPTTHYYYCPLPLTPHPAIQEQDASPGSHASATPLAAGGWSDDPSTGVCASVACEGRRRGSFVMNTTENGTEQQGQQSENFPLDKDEMQIRSMGYKPSLTGRPRTGLGVTVGTRARTRLSGLTRTRHPTRRQTPHLSSLVIGTVHYSTPPPPPGRFSPPLPFGPFPRC